MSALVFDRDNPWLLQEAGLDQLTQP
jgi:hypothetical protein